MQKDFHTHPQVLTKPEGVDAFLSQAKKKGIEAICFTDHMPLSISRAKDRMPAGSVKEYCQKVRQLQKEYEGEIRILCGVEIDFHPSVKDEVLAVLEEGEFDYILGSTHMHLFCKEYSNITKDDFAKMALENSLAAAESGLFSALSHFDMFRFPFTRPDRFPFREGGEYDPLRHEKLIRTVLEKTAENGLYLEINPHLAEAMGDNTDYLYPQRSVLKWAFETEGMRFSFGSDAHKPEDVGAMLPQIKADPLYGKALALWEKE